MAVDHAPAFRSTSCEQIIDGGVRAFPDALWRLFASENAGKLVLAVSTATKLMGDRNEQ
jgi:hypothetical protein